MSEKKQSRTKRANLHFPIYKVRRQIKAKLGPKRRLQKNVEVVVTALAEFVVQQLLITASEKVVKGNYIDASHLHTTINENDSEVAGIFPKHATGMY